MTSQFNPPLNFPATNAPTSNWIDKHGNDLIGFYTPATMVSTSMTFSGASDQDATFVPIKAVSGALAISFTITTNSYYGFTNDQIMQFRGVRYIEGVLPGNETAPVKILLALTPKSNF